MGACGANPLLRPVFRMGHIPFLELFARGDIRRHSGQLSGALRVRAVRPCARRAADRRRRRAASTRWARRCSIRRISRSWSTARWSSRDEAGKAFAALGPAARARSDHRRISSACSPGTAARSELRAVIRAFRRLAAEHRGETTAEVVTAHPLNDDQVAALKAQLRTRAGRDVTIDATVDPAILGGLVVKLGSQMIDASIRTKLNRLASGDERLRQNHGYPRR